MMKGQDVAPNALTIEEAIGQNVAKAREALGLSQVELGERVAAYLGKPWPRQTVSAVERGNRAFTAAEVVALAHILGTTTTLLFRLPAEADGVTVGDVAVPRRELQGVAAPGEAPGLLLELLDDVRDAWAHAVSARRMLSNDVVDPLDSMERRIAAQLARLAGHEGEE